jgi:hypothetical protein
METIENTRQLRLGDADTGVRHRQSGVITAPSQADLNASRKGVLESF